MATLTPTLTIASTDATTDELNLSVTANLAVGPPSIGISKTIVAVSSGTATVLVPAGSENQYTYIKHTGFQGDGTTASANELWHLN